jgi:hypothetical protein
MEDIKKTFVDEADLNLRERLMLKTIKEFYSEKKYLNKFIEIINGTSQISLRIVDWFVTNYCKEKHTKYNIKIKGNLEIFDVNEEYNTELNSYSKDYFDPFCRKQKIYYACEIENNGVIKNKKIETSLCQLNFFMWAIKYKIIDHISLLYTDIVDHMNRTNKQNKQIKKELLLSQESDISEEKSYLEMLKEEESENPISSEISICVSSEKKSKGSKSLRASKLMKDSPTSSEKKKRVDLTKSSYKGGVINLAQTGAIKIRLGFE